MWKLFRDRLPLIIYTVLAILLPILWLRGNYIVIPEEYHFADYQKLIEDNLYSWSGKLNYGEPSGQWNHSLIIPNGLLYALLNWIGLNTHWTQIVFLQFYLFFVFLSISLFIKIFTRNNLLNVVGSFAYVFNFFFITTIGYSAKMYQVLLLPLLFYITYKFLTTQKYKYISLNYILVFVFQGIFTNLPQAITTLIVYPIAFCFHFYQNGFRLKDTKKSVLFLLLPLPVYAYQSLIYLFTMLSTGLTQNGINGFRALISPLSKVFQLRGVWWEDGGVGGVVYNNWLNFFNNPIITFSTFIIFAISLTYLLYKSKDNRYLYFLLVFILSVFIASGTSLFPGIFEFMYDHIPYYWIFREPWAKFMPIVSWSLIVLLILSLEKRSRLVHIAVLVLVLLRVFPFVSDNFIDRTNRDWKKMFVSIPPYWKEFGEWSQNRSESNILVLPLRFEGNKIEYRWYPEYGNANVPIYHLVGHTNIIGLNKYYSQGRFLKILSSLGASPSAQLLKIAPIDYVLLQYDVENSTVDNTTSIAEFNGFIDSDPIASFGNKLQIYKIKEQYNLPKIFVPSNIIVTRTTEDLISIIKNKSLKIGDAVYLNDTSSSINSEIIGFADNYGRGKSQINKSELEIKYKKINPTQFEVNILHGKGVLPIVFLENYSSLWRLNTKEQGQIKIKDLFRFLINKNNNYEYNSYHSEINGYANIWIVNINKLCGASNHCITNKDGTYTVNLEIKYFPQKWFNLLFSFSFIIFIFSLLSLFLSKSVKKSISW